MMDKQLHGLSPASAWIQRFTQLVPVGGRVLDVACGHGRHMRWFAQHGYAVTGVDRDAEALATLTGLGETVCADLENGQPWPLAGRQFEAVVVTNYLWRPLLPDVLASVALDGVLLYETFAAGNETVGRPARPEFLLRPGELLQLVGGAGPGWTVVAYENGYEAQPERFVQRIAAVRSGQGTGLLRYPLH